MSHDNRPLPSGILGSIQAVVTNLSEKKYLGLVNCYTPMMLSTRVLSASACQIATLKGYTDTLALRDKSITACSLSEIILYIPITNKMQLRASFLNKSIQFPHAFLTSSEHLSGLHVQRQMYL